MRPLFYLSVLLLFSCSSKESKEETKIVMTETEKLNQINSRIVDRLSDEKEIIILLSEVRKVSFDTLNLILRDYYVATDTVSVSANNSRKLYQNAIATVAGRYKISRSKIAALIFSYKYEMLTKEDIEESAIEDFQSDYEPEPPEPEDPE